MESAVNEPSWVGDILSDYRTPTTITLVYLCLLKVLPALMKNREPLQLKSAILLYNILQIFMNLRMMQMGFSLMGMKLFNFWANTCNPVSAVNQGRDVRSEVSSVLIYFYINKIIDLLDTIFFRLRKKDSQVTFLHVFHHSSIIILAWSNAYKTIEELSVLLVWINAFVHAVMYSYYLLAGLGPKVQKYLWWKKYVTTMQIIQFLVVLSIYLKMTLEGCNPQSWYTTMWIAEVSVILSLFVHFYRESYGVGKRKQK